MEIMHEGADNLKIVRQDTTILDCAISPKQGTNPSIRTFSSHNTIPSSIRIKAETNSHSGKNDVNKANK